MREELYETEIEQRKHRTGAEWVEVGASGGGLLGLPKPGKGYENVPEREKTQ
jgi:hypothetical protein